MTSNRERLAADDLWFVASWVTENLSLLAVLKRSGIIRHNYQESNLETLLMPWYSNSVGVYCIRYSIEEVGAIPQ